MTRRHDPDDPEHRASRDVSDLPMFATATELGLAARDTAVARHRDVIDRLVPIARELAQKAGTAGVTVSDLRLVAVQRGLLTGEERNRDLAFMGSVMQRAGLRNTGLVRRSVIHRSHGNRHTVWADA